jgi:RimJ/RimL family protein N-acetyltransferase
MTLAWRNKEGVRRWFQDPGVRSKQDHLRWYRGYAESDNDFVFIIELPGEDPRPIGQASIFDIDWETGQGEFGRLIVGDPEATGKGYGKAATELLLAFSFTELGLTTIFLTMLAGNEPALRIYTACGFSILSQDERSITMTLTRR